MHAFHGRIVWHELATTDRDAAKAFYTKIALWKTEPWEDAKNYELFTVDGQAIGGVTTVNPGTNAAPSWMPFVLVYDVDAAVRQASTLGGTVRSAPKEIPHVGGWAVITDPQGASIGLFEAADKPPGHDREPAIGEFSWHELATDDYRAAAEFYRVMFRWEKTDEFDMGPMGVYYMFGRAGIVYGGMFKRPPEILANYWLSYIRVPDVKPVAEQVTQLGGTVITPPMEVPGGDWIAQCMDPQGAAFALHSKK
jgi:predicted enzyme related to lactoylglutathione lyase